MLLPAEYNLLILAERRAAERIASLLHRVRLEEEQGLRGYSSVDVELKHARRSLEAIAAVLEHSSSRTAEDVKRALAA